MSRLIALLACNLAAALPAIAGAEPSDIAAAARGVVRVVIVGTDGEKVFPIGHGTGFAITPTRIVTNAHVVRELQQDDTLRLAVVPPDGEAADYARIVAVSSAKDLALLEITGPLRVPPLTLGGTVPGDGDAVAAVGYPMNVDRAQGLDLADLFRPQPPVKSRGFVSSARPSRDLDTILHTAAIARGNSGGPLLDGCGRVLGVNSFGTTSEDGNEAEFSFAVSDRELLPFLKANGIDAAISTQPCRSLAQLDAAERERLAGEQTAARARLAERAEADRDRRDRARMAAQLSVMDDRENGLAMALVLLLASAAAGFGAWNLRSRDDGGKAMRIAGAGAAALAVAALAVWFTRPGIDAIDRRVAAALAEAEGGSAAAEGGAGAGGGAPTAAGEFICTIQAERSRIVGQPAEDLDFAWEPGGCVNGRTQYGANGGTWSRLFVPNEEDTVAVNSFDPATREFRTDRYPLSQSVMSRARAARGAYRAPVCGSPDAARKLGELQSGVTALLPARPTERLVYGCKPKGGA